MIRVLVHGCYDILHAGHFEHLREARQMGDRLIVSITAARWIAKAKGNGHPATTDHERLLQLQDLRIVDQVWLCDDPTGVPAILKFKPTFYVKGSDYLERGICEPERFACQQVGAIVRYTTACKRSVVDLVSGFSQPGAPG